MKRQPSWGKAGQRSLERSALIEATTQLTRALDEFAKLPLTPALRREQIKLQIALANALMHAKGHAAPDTKAALDQARTLIERAERVGEPLEDPLLLFSALYGVWVANLVMFNGEAIRGLAAHFLALADKQNATVPLMMGHRLVGASLLYTAEAAEARAHLDQALALYDPVKHGPLGTRFGYDVAVATLSYRALALWILGYPEAALKTRRARSGMRAYGRRKSETCSSRYIPDHGIKFIVETTEQQTCKLMKRWRWRKRGVPCRGKQPEG